mmetsp:Transcript_1261/g.1429  ORF Transcript_1261/g.1429 Transcript_1261/m.1429 type:complete len:196 (-) Transcript_1261:49-636(-)
MATKFNANNIQDRDFLFYSLTNANREQSLNNLFLEAQTTIAKFRQSLAKELAETKTSQPIANFWTVEEIELLKELYDDYVDDGELNLSGLVNAMKKSSKRTKSRIAQFVEIYHHAMEAEGTENPLSGMKSAHLKVIRRMTRDYEAKEAKKAKKEQSTEVKEEDDVEMTDAGEDSEEDDEDDNGQYGSFDEDDLDI